MGRHTKVSCLYWMVKTISKCPLVFYSKWMRKALQFESCGLVLAEGVRRQCCAYAGWQLAPFDKFLVHIHLKTA